MSHRAPLVIVIAVALLALVIAPAAAQTRAPGWQRDMVEVVVELDAAESPAAYAPYFLSRLNVPPAEQEGRVNHIYEHSITGFSVYLSATELAAADRLFTPGSYGVHLVLAAPELRVPDMSLFGIAPGGVLPTTAVGPGLLIPTNLARTEAPLPETPGQYSDIDVAVIDTGVDRAHPNLNVVGGTDCTAAPEDRDSYGIDPYGHGTHVAGTIGARYGDAGVVGFAPGARLWDVRVLDAGGGGSMASIICGIDFVAEHAIPIANMSLGGSLPPTDCNGPDPMHNAICIASETTTFVVSAGNGGVDAAGQVPASYDEVVTVSAFADFNGAPGGAALTPADRCGAMSVDDELAAFSNFGELVEIAAPGVCILSAAPGEIDDDGVYEPAYAYLSGTSMSAPAVSGAIARWLSVNKGADQREHAAEHIIAWSAINGTGDRYDGAHTDTPAPLLFVGELPGRWHALPEPEFTDPTNISR